MSMLVDTVDTTEQTGKKIILTDIGEQKRRYSISSNATPLILSYMAVGDGGADVTVLPYLDPTKDRIANEVWRGQIISVQALERQNQGKFLVTAYIPKDELGMVYLKEFGIYSNNNELIYWGHLDNFYKPAVEAQNTQGVIIQVTIDWRYNYGLDLFASNRYTYAMKEETLREEDNLTGYAISKPYLYYMVQITK